jgi:bis(5'-nucleosidyl)-tetraphosphatase
MLEYRVLSSGIIIVRKQDNNWLYLLLRAYSYWDFPKGIVEKGESPIEGAKREVEEETTIKSLFFDWGFDYRETEPYNKGKIARYYIARTEESNVNLPVNPLIGKPEHDEFRWVAYSDAIDVVSIRVRPILDWADLVINGKRPAS